MISPSTVVRNDPAEHRLLAAGWRNPVELARVCDALTLRYLDFADRLAGVAIGYLRTCADRGVTPDLNEAERMLSERAVPRSPGELYHILQQPVTPGDRLADLALAVQRGADERTDELCRALARDGLRTLQHAFNCADCIRCQRENRQRRRSSVRRNGTAHIARRRAAYV